MSLEKDSLEKDSLEKDSLEKDSLEKDSLEKEEDCGICLLAPSRRRKLFSICNVCNGNSCLSCWSQLLKITNPRSNNFGFTILCPYCRTVIPESHLKRSALWNSRAYNKIATLEYERLGRFLIIDNENWREAAKAAVRIIRTISEQQNTISHFIGSYDDWRSYDNQRPLSTNPDVQQEWLHRGES
jgi:hypothetical protein